MWSCAPDDRESDQQPPSVLQIVPDNGTTSEKISTRPQIVFSEAISPASLIRYTGGNCTGTVQLTDNSSNCVETELNLSASGEILTINPLDNLSFATEYIIKLTTGIEDLSGHSLASEHLSHFTTIAENDSLADISRNQLRSDLREMISSYQIDTILASATEQLNYDNLSVSKDPSKVLPSFLAGSMTGIGKAEIGSDNLTSQVINKTTATVTSLIGEFEEQLKNSSRIHRDSANQAVFEFILVAIIEVTVEGLVETGLSESARGEAFGAVVGTVISNLGTSTDPSQVGSSVQAITQKAVQKAAKIPRADPSAVIQSVTKNAISSLGNANLSPSEVTTTLSITVQMVVATLDEVEGSPELEVTTLVAEVTTSSMEGLAELVEAQEENSQKQSIDVTEAMSGIISGATDAVGELSSGDENLDLGAAIASMSQSFTAAITSITTDVSQLATLTQAAQQQIEVGVKELGDANPDLNITEIQEAAANGLLEGLTEAEVVLRDLNLKGLIPEPTPTSCNFKDQLIRDGDYVLAFISKNVAHDNTCKSELRLCNNGNLYGTFEYITCTRDEEPLQLIGKSFGRLAQSYVQGALVWADRRDSNGNFDYEFNPESEDWTYSGTFGEYSLSPDYPDYQIVTMGGIKSGTQGNFLFAALMIANQAATTQGELHITPLTTLVALRSNLENVLSKFGNENCKVDIASNSGVNRNLLIIAKLVEIYWMLLANSSNPILPELSQQIESLK